MADRRQYYIVPWYHALVAKAVGRTLEDLLIPADPEAGEYRGFVSAHEMFSAELPEAMSAEACAGGETEGSGWCQP